MEEALSAHCIIDTGGQCIDCILSATGRLDHHSVYIIWRQAFKCIHLRYWCKQDPQISWANSAVVTDNADNMPARVIVRCVERESISHFETRLISSVFANDDDILISAREPAPCENLFLIELCIQLYACQLRIAPVRWHLILPQFFNAGYARYCLKDLLKAAKRLCVGCRNHHVEVIRSIDPVKQRIE